MADIFIVGQPIPKVWMHMEFDFIDTVKYINERKIETQEEADDLHTKYIGDGSTIEPS